MTNSVLNLGETFKVWFYSQDMDVAEVRTYHNVISQSDLLEWMAGEILTNNYMDVVRVIGSDGRNLSAGASQLVRESIAELERVAL